MKTNTVQGETAQMFTSKEAFLAAVCPHSDKDVLRTTKKNRICVVRCPHCLWKAKIARPELNKCHCPRFAKGACAGGCGMVHESRRKTRFHEHRDDNMGKLAPLVPPGQRQKAEKKKLGIASTPASSVPPSPSHSSASSCSSWGHEGHGQVTGHSGEHEASDAVRSMQWYCHNPYSQADLDTTHSSSSSSIGKEDGCSHAGRGGPCAQSPPAMHCDPQSGGQPVAVHEGRSQEPLVVGAVNIPPRCFTC